MFLGMLKFAEMSKATIDSVQRGMEVLQDVYSELAKSITAYALGTNQTWPYVTYPYWDDIAAHAQAVATTMACSTIMLVHDPIEWVKYTQEHA
jgi:hypothetical protein